MNDTLPRGDALTERRRWLALLAQAPRDMLHGLVDSLMTEGFETLRAPETGLCLLQARIAGGGDRFHLGEATLTRCVLRHRGADGLTVIGVGYVLGRDTERARWIAAADALLQRPERHEALRRGLLAPLARAVLSERAAARAATADSRVRFHTLQADPSHGARA
jgi:alpha-D-ribose 1-methylphosphonate 5-triphosphate synthase subunit PhnG